MYDDDEFNAVEVLCNMKYKFHDMGYYNNKDKLIKCDCDSCYSFRNKVNICETALYNMALIRYLTHLKKMNKYILN